MKVTFDKKLNILDEATIADGPRGNGNLTSRASFVQETLYQTEAYSNDLNIFERAGLRYTGQQYGKLNDNFLSIIPREQVLENTENNALLLNFVLDAYTAFDLNLQLLKQRGSIPKKSPIFNFESQKFTNNINELYFSFFQREYQLFLEFVNENKYDKNITNFDSFLEVFLKFVDIRTPSVPLTKSSFLASKYVSKKINGLIIDLADEDPLDDSIKYNKFIKDLAFKCYLDIVSDSGFVVNQDQPWQIIANLDSTKMKFYFMLRMKQLVKDNIIFTSPVLCESNIYEECEEELKNFDLRKFLFNKNDYLNMYEVVNYDDIKSLKRMIGRMYNSYVDLKPQLITLEPKKENNFYYFNKTIEKRQKVDVPTLISSPENSKWIRVYSYIKCRENNMSFDQKKFDSVAEKTYSLYSSLDISHAMDYIQSEINRSGKYKRKNTNFKF